MSSRLTMPARKAQRGRRLDDASVGVGSLVPRSVGIGSKAADEVEIVNESEALPHIMPQVTEVRCHGYAGPILWHRFKSWKLRLDFHLLCADEETILSAWFNLGRGANPAVGRGSRYRAAWILANDGEVPGRNDRLSPKVFVGKVFKVRIGDSGRDKAAKDKAGGAGGEVYSVIHEILERTGP